MSENSSFKGLSGNTLKYIAALSMLIDHAGLLLFPQLPLLRVIGRIAFPIFAFMIAEGCLHTRNRLRYFLGITLLGLVCHAVQYAFAGSPTLNVLITFSISIVLIFVLLELKKALLLRESRSAKPLELGLLLLLLLLLGYFFCSRFPVDYEFAGCLVPLFAALPGLDTGEKDPAAAVRRRRLSVLCMLPPLLLVCHIYIPMQYFCLAALPLLLLYNGQRGRRSTKYFFYVFYPLHLALLQGIAWLIH